MRRKRGASAAGKESLPQMNADRPTWWVRDWLNSRVSHRDICVHLRSSAAKIPFSLIGQPQPNATRQGPDNAHPHPATPSPTAPFKPSRTDPLSREPAAKPASTAPFKPFHIDPLNREPMASPGSAVPFKPSLTDRLNLIRPLRAPQPRRPHLAQGNPVKQARPGALPPWSASRPMPTKRGKAPRRLSGRRSDRIAPAVS